MRKKEQGREKPTLWIGLGQAGPYKLLDRSLREPSREADRALQKDLENLEV